MTKLLAIFTLGLSFGTSIVIGFAAYILVKGMIEMLKEKNYIGFAVLSAVLIMIISAAGFIFLMV